MSDDAQEARHFFEVVTILCLLFFGIPLGIVSLRIAGGLFTGPVGAVGYEDLHLLKDLAYAAILTALAVVPIVGSYIRFKRLEQET
jgi:hypothetical protein